MEDENKNPHHVTPDEAGKLYCAVQPQWGCCSGPKCMAWRWADVTSYEEQNPTVTYSKTHGYCGMVIHG